VHLPLPPLRDYDLVLPLLIIILTACSAKQLERGVVLVCLVASCPLQFARTEHIKNNLNPNFATPIQISYRFEEVQRLKFKVHDVDNATSTLDDDDFLGEHECTLAQIVTAGVYTQDLTLGKKAKGKAGKIIVRAEEVSSSKNVLKITMNGVGLDKKDLFGKSDPYLELAKENQDGTFATFHRTKVIKNTLNPFWPPFSLKANLFGDEKRRIRVTCYDWDSDGSHDLIGVFHTSLSELQSGEKLRWNLINEKKTKKKNYKNSGVIECSVEVRVEHSFFEYIVGGCQLNFTIGIDFTGSNGDPKMKGSLHYLDPHLPVAYNQYTEALTAVGSVVQDYDTDKLFPAFGFGAKLPGQQQASHEFPLNANPQNPYCNGIQGVLDAYRYSLSNVKLWGPTNAAPIINHVAQFARQADSSPESQVYFILLMLTDGELTDMSDTKTAIIRASQLPMSVIIVGVGLANFASMVALDSDDNLLSHNGEKAVRDIVQFVPYRQFQDASKEALAKAVLAEIPSQVVEYYSSKGISPRQRPSV
jgi:hypothetical protein